jgi:hypothetical protein
VRSSNIVAFALVCWAGFTVGSAVAQQQGSAGPMQPIIRVSILRCAPERFAELRQMMIDADAVLRPGIEAMSGLIAYYAGADEATSSLSNVSIWTSLEAAKQMDTFQPMLNLGKAFAERARRSSGRS